ncbi:MAG: hypothetical protein QHC79_28225 [Pseudosphingobacterium sp.]|nr:hypothetical protein [Pseudosphingobacterium sp.]
MKVVHNFIAIVVFLTLLASCSVFKKKDVIKSSLSTEVSYERQTSEESQSDTETVTESNEQTISTDDYDITVTDGKINITPDGSITAEGKNIKAKGNKNRKSNKQDSTSTSTKQNAAKTIEAKANKKEEKNTVEKHKEIDKDSSINGWVGAAVFILILAGGVFMYRRFK